MMLGYLPGRQGTVASSGSSNSSRGALSLPPRIVQSLQVGASVHLVSPVPRVPVTWLVGMWERRKPSAFHGG